VAKDIIMDNNKRDQLKTQLSTRREPCIVPIEVFFDGNDDEASIGCNLTNHPGIGTFRDILVGLVSRPDVVAVYTQITEIDPGEEYWPFADWVFVVGTISREELASILSPLHPDDVDPPGNLGVPDAITRKHDAPVLVAWWD
jgi:hypothetical protein